jgi:hypothetical protein
MGAEVDVDFVCAGCGTVLRFHETETGHWLSYADLDANLPPHTD